MLMKPSRKSRSSCITISNLMTIIVSYFDMNTRSIAIKAERTTGRTSQAYFVVGNLHGVGFLISAGKFVTIIEPNNRPDDIVFYLLRSIVTANTVDARVPLNFFVYSSRCSYLKIILCLQLLSLRIPILVPFLYPLSYSSR